MKFKKTVWNTSSSLYHFENFYEKFVASNRIVYILFYGDEG